MVFDIQQPELNRHRLVGYGFTAHSVLSSEGLCSNKHTFGNIMG